MRKKNLKPSNTLEILTGRDKDNLLELENSGIFLHKDVIKPFKELQQLGQREIGADIQIISGHRSFEKQLQIWNLKASGQRQVLDKAENPVQINGLSPKQIVNLILNWSAIPGCSRHHWGTDFDIYDASKLSKDEVKLTNSECIKDGVFEELHSWLDGHLNQSDFFRPYDSFQGGVGVEKWHLSFSPISQTYLDLFDFEIFLAHIQSSQILYKEIIIDDAKFYFENFVKLITPP